MTSHMDTMFGIVVASLAAVFVFTFYLSLSSSDRAERRQHRAALRRRERAEERLLRLRRARAIQELSARKLRGIEEW